MSTLMVLGARAMQLPLINRARDMEVCVVVVDPDPNAPGLTLGDERAEADLADVDTCLDIARAYQVDGVLTFAADYPVRTAAAVADFLDLPGPSPKTAEATTDKRLLRQTLAEHELASPMWEEIASPQAATRFLSGIEDDVIMKPALSSGGRGVTQVSPLSDPATIARAFEHATQFGDGNVLVEEFVRGPDFSVEFAIADEEPVAVTVTDKRSAGAPHWVEIGHSQPTQRSEGSKDALAATAKQAAQALEMRHCIAHVELRLTEVGPVVIEAAARAAGGYIASHLVPLSTGVDLMEAAIQIALGEEPHLNGVHRQGAAVRFFSAKPGVVTSISGLDEARRSPGVEHIDLDVRVGDRIVPLQDSRHRFGQVICTGADGPEAMAGCDAAAGRLRIETEAE